MSSQGASTPDRRSRSLAEDRGSGGHLASVLQPVFCWVPNTAALFLSLNAEMHLLLRDYSAVGISLRMLLNISTGNSTLCMLTNMAGLLSYSTSSFFREGFLRCPSAPAGIISRLFSCLSQRHHRQGQSFGSFSGEAGCTSPCIAAKVI